MKIKIENEEIKRDQIYRDSKYYYLKQSDGTPKNIIDFIKKHAGQKILDLGCATGNCSIELSKHGFCCIGVDINKKYVIKIKEKGIDGLIMDGTALAFSGKSFDTVLLIEVLEHIPDPIKILKEAKRVAKKNILITVPNCGQYEELRKIGLTYEHFLELDHVNFFTKGTLGCLISKCFRKYKIVENEPINSHKLLPNWIRKPIGLLVKLKIIKPTLHTRLFAVIYLTDDVNE